MLAYLSGKIINKRRDYIIICVKDVGYKIFVNHRIYSELKIGQLFSVYIYQHIREDVNDLYGFCLIEELEIFELLLSVSGVGPKSALAVLSIADIKNIEEAVVNGDPSLLTKVSGIGKKTAERVILELREKIIKTKKDWHKGDASSNISANSDEIDALMALGYSLTQAREALMSIDPSIKDSGNRIKEALKNLGN
ncbi:MAG: Holliday junction branch migration protein RuvA [Patescibacteria group bacterium]|nr:Holliday junction branch migration protein RuvA [Patescibacteria group bacterium]